MCLSLMRTGAGVIKYAVFNVLNRFQTYSSNISDCTITAFDVFALQIFFFSQCCVCKCSLCPLGLCNFFFTNSSTELVANK